MTGAACAHFGGCGLMLALAPFARFDSGTPSPDRLPAPAPPRPAYLLSNLAADEEPEVFEPAEKVPFDPPPPAPPPIEMGIGLDDDEEPPPLIPDPQILLAAGLST